MTVSGALAMMTVLAMAAIAVAAPDSAIDRRYSVVGPVVRAGDEVLSGDGFTLAAAPTSPARPRGDGYALEPRGGSCGASAAGGDGNGTCSCFCAGLPFEDGFETGSTSRWSATSP